MGQASFFQHQVAHYDSRHTIEVSDGLDELTCPVHIVLGEDDTWQVIDWAYGLHRTIGGSQLTVIPGCGHFAMEDRPAEAAAALITGLDAPSDTRHHHNH